MQRGNLILVAAATGVFTLVSACGGGGGGRAPHITGQAARGEQLTVSLGCHSCHSTDGSRGTGPTWKGLAGSNVRLADGSTVMADPAYLRQKILDPSATTVAGFPAGLMSAALRTKGITQEQADAIVAYLQTLGTSSR